MIFVTANEILIPFIPKKLVYVYLGIVPLWFLRYAPAIQISEMKKCGGFIVLFKTQIYPPGQELLVKEIWNHMRLPVNVWKDIPARIEERLEDIHAVNLKKIHKENKR